MPTVKDAYDLWRNDSRGYVWYWGGYYSAMIGKPRSTLSDELNQQQRNDWLHGYDDWMGREELEDLR
jgi:hypothetical protein